MDKPVDVVGIGSCTVDYFAIVPRLLGPEEKINAERMEIHAGGVTANNLTQVARLGAGTGWLGLIGDDENGRIIQKAFADDGMDLSGIEIVKGEHSSLTWIPVDSAGERCIYMFPNITGKISVYQVDGRFAPHIKKAKHFHTEASQLPIAPVKEGMRIAKEASVRVIFDLDVSPSFFAQSNLGAEACGRAEAVQGGGARINRRDGLRKNSGETSQSGTHPRRDHHGNRRMPDCQPQTESARRSVQAGCGGHHRRGRCVHGRSFVCTAARMGSAARWDFCQCMCGDVLHPGWRARHVEARGSSCVR
jgi:hypothetical protein